MEKPIFYSSTGGGIIGNTSASYPFARLIIKENLLELNVSGLGASVVNTTIATYPKKK